MVTKMSRMFCLILILIATMAISQEVDDNPESLGQKHLSSQDLLQLLPKDLGSILTKPAKEMKNKEDNAKSDLPDFFGLLGGQMFSMLRKLLKTNPKLASKMMTNVLKSQKWLSKEHTTLILGITEGLMGNEHLLNLTLTTLEGIDAFLHSESGRRVIKLMPEIKSASSERVLELFQQEANYNQDLFLTEISTNGLSIHFTKTIARISNGLYKALQNLLQDDLKLTVMNGMLVAKEWPIIDRNHTLASFIRIIENLLNFLSPYKRLEMRLTNDVEELVSDLEHQYFNSSQLAELSEVEMENLIVNFLEDSLFQPVKNVWVAYKGLSDARCAKYVVCLYNGQYREHNEIRKTVARLLSMGLAYSWSNLNIENKSEEDHYKGLYDAIRTVYENDKQHNHENNQEINDFEKSSVCWSQFVSKVGLADVCHDVFEEERMIRSGQDLGFEHTEL